MPTSGKPAECQEVSRVLPGAALGKEGVDKRIQGSSAVYQSTVRANQSLAWEARDNYERELSMHASLSTTELAPKTID